MPRPERETAELRIAQEHVKLLPCDLVALIAAAL